MSTAYSTKHAVWTVQIFNRSIQWVRAVQCCEMGGCRAGLFAVALPLPEVSACLRYLSYLVSV